MPNMAATTVTSGATTTATLTTGTLSSWVATGAQVYLYSGSTLGNASATGGTTLTVVDSTHFTVPSAGLTTAAQNASGLQVLIASVLSGFSNAFQQNCATIPPASGTASKAAGALGFDQGFSVDLAPAGLSGSVLWFMGDTSWATAASQARGATTNFVHSCVGIQTGGNYTLNYNTSGSPQSGSDSIAFYGPTAGSTSPVPLFNLKRPGLFSYPVSGICINQYCTLVAVQLQAVPGPTFPALSLVWINNINTSGSVTAPSSWNVVEITPNPFGELLPGPTNTTQWVTYTDSFGTWVMCMGQAGLNRNVYAFRFPFNDLNIGATGTPYLGNIQYWCGPQGWVAADLMQSPQPVYPQLWPSFQIAPAFAVDFDNSGGLYQRSDGIWVYVNEIVIGLGEMFCSENAAVTGPPFGTGGSFKQFWYDSGASQGSPSGFNTYGLRTHAQQKWAGQGTDDMLVSYDTSAASATVLANTETYWPVFLATSGL